MLCKNCKHGAIFFVVEHVFGIKCKKYGIKCDTTHPEDRQCIEEDNDVIWRAGWEKGERYDGR